MITRVLAMFDDSPAASAALAHAADFAAAMNVPLTVWFADGFQSDAQSARAAVASQSTLTARSAVGVNDTVAPTEIARRTSLSLGHGLSVGHAPVEATTYLPAPRPLLDSVRKHARITDLLAFGWPSPTSLDAIPAAANALIAAPPCRILVALSPKSRLRHIITPFIGTTGARAALKLADQLSQRLNLPLEVLTMGSDQSLPAELEAEARSILGPDRSRETELIQVQSQRSIEEGALIQRLANQDSTALLVLAGDPGSVFTDLFFGPHFGRLAERLTGPVILVPG